MKIVIYRVEICGDGINLGLVECDDGNNIDGDGCSSDCEVESGYKCTNRAAEDLPDLCYDVMAPTATLTVSKKNLLEIKFSETVVFKVDCILSISIS